MKKPVVGFLPLYLELYDEVMPEMRAEVEAFADTLVKAIGKRGVEVAAAPVCRVRREFAKAVRDFERRQVDAIVTVHLAYSPSLESADILAATDLPLIILDTTPDFDFGFTTDASRIMTNHGIHGVQDLCNVLLRKGKRFMLEVGHWQQSDVLNRVMMDIRACVAASTMRAARVGLIGKPFAGMGDFAIPFARLKKDIGLEVVRATPALLKSARPAPREAADEVKRYRKDFRIGEVSETCLTRTATTSLTVRQWMAREKLTAFTFNFMDIDRTCGLGTAPFLEASLAMSRGIGYAGEGDVLTAAFVSSLSSVFPATSFSEMFCPDWKGNRIFLSHMGELNVKVMQGKPELCEKDFPFIKSKSSALAVGCMKPGKAALVNLAPGADGAFALIVCPGDIRAPRKGTSYGIYGWFAPQRPIEEMLSRYSLQGGTHHLALVYQPNMQVLSRYAGIMGWECVTI